MSDKMLLKTNMLVSVKEAALLREEQLSRLIHSTDLGELLRILQETQYASYFKEGLHSDLEETIDKITSDLLIWGYDAGAGNEIVDIYASQEAFHNLKFLIKEELTGVEIKDIELYGSRYSLDDLRTLIRTGKSDILPEEFGLAVLEVKKDFEENASLQRVEIIVDKYYFALLKNLALETGEVGIINFVAEFIDIHNISVLEQLSKDELELSEIAFVEGGKIEIRTWFRLFALSKDERNSFFRESVYSKLWSDMKDQENTELYDVIADNYLIKKTITAKLKPFGKLPFAAYLFARIMEIRNLRIILFAKKYGVSTDIIQERMRNLYEL